MRTVVVVNLQAREARRRTRELADRLRAAGIAPEAFVTVRGGRDVHRQVKRAVKKGAQAVLVAGGDGSIAMAADAIGDRDAILGVIPFGTGNSFAQTIGLRPYDVAQAVHTVAGGRTLAVDVGTANGRRFVGFATIGFAAAVAKNVPHEAKSILGKFAYAFAALAPLARSRSFRAKITHDGGKVDLQTRQIVIAAGRLFGKTPVTPDASPLSGKLALFTTRGGSLVELLRTYVAMALHRQTTLPEAVVLSADRLEVRTKRRQPVNLDGAPAGKTPARFDVIPRGLRVFVPEEFCIA